MAEQTSIVEEGVDRFNSAYESVDKEVRRLQKQLQSRRKSLEKQLSSSRKTIEKRARKQVKQIRTDLDRNSLVKRARGFQADAVKQIEQGVDSLLGTLQIASKGDLRRIDRKLTQINKKLKDIERTRKTAVKSNGNGGSATL